MTDEDRNSVFIPGRSRLAFKQLLTNPRRDQCKGRLLSVALQLLKEGYTHNDISSAALGVASHHAMEAGTYSFWQYLDSMENRGRIGKERLEHRLEMEAQEREAARMANGSD